MTNQPTNADRADWAKDALAVFTTRTYSGDHPDSMDRDDLESAISDLICDLLHYSQQQDMDAGNVIQRSAGHFGYEIWGQAQEQPALPRDEASNVPTATPETPPSKSKPCEPAPGPYFYQRDKDGCDDVWHIISAEGYVVASIHFWDEPDTNERAESEANARLLAAAPELLSALERLTSCAQSLYLTLDPDPRRRPREAGELRRAYRVAFGLIAKARGIRP